MSQDWEAVGILHDIDFEMCTGPQDHTIVARDILCDQLDQTLIEAIMAHNHEHTRVPVDNDIKRALICSDAVSGLIIAATLVLPSKKIADVNPKSLMKKYNSKDFAKGVSRERIALCAELGFELGGVPRDSPHRYEGDRSRDRPLIVRARSDASNYLELNTFMRVPYE